MDKQQVAFTFSKRSLANLKEMVEHGEFSSMGEVVQDSLNINQALRKQVEQGFTEIIVRDPETQREKILLFSSHYLRR